MGAAASHDSGRVAAMRVLVVLVILLPALFSWAIVRGGTQKPTPRIGDK
jgi:hypothetical protein